MSEFDCINCKPFLSSTILLHLIVNHWMPWEIVENKVNIKKNYVYLKMSLAIVLTAVTTWMFAKNYFEKDMSLPIEPVNRWKIAFFILLTMVVLILMIYMIWYCRKRWIVSRYDVKRIPWCMGSPPMYHRRPRTPSPVPKTRRHGRDRHGEARDNGNHRRSSTHSSSSSTPHAKAASDRGRAAMQHRWMMNSDNDATHRVGHHYDTI